MTGVTSFWGICSYTYSQRSILLWGIDVQQLEHIQHYIFFDEFKRLQSVVAMWFQNNTLNLNQNRMNEIALVQ